MDSDASGGKSPVATANLELKDLSIRTEQADGILVAHLDGQLGGTNCREFESSMGGILGDESPRLVLDLGKVSFLSSAGLSSILSLARKVRRSGGNVVACCLEGSVKAVFRISGFHMVVPAYDSTAEALEALRK